MWYYGIIPMEGRQGARSNVRSFFFHRACMLHVHFGFNRMDGMIKAHKKGGQFHDS